MPHSKPDPQSAHATVVLVAGSGGHVVVVVVVGVARFFADATVGVHRDCDDAQHRQRDRSSHQRGLLALDRDRGAVGRSLRGGLLVGPAEIGCEQRGHIARGVGGGVAVEQTRARAAIEHVGERAGHLVSYGEPGLGLEVGEPGHERLAERGIGAHERRVSSPASVPYRPARWSGSDVRS